MTCDIGVLKTDVKIGIKIPLPRVCVCVCQMCDGVVAGYMAFIGNGADTAK